MRQSKIPLWVGLTGLLLFEAGCTDSPAAPQLIQRRTPVETLSVLVRNDTDRSVAVSLETSGAVIGIGQVAGGSTELFQIAALDLRGEDEARFVATSSADGKALVSEFLSVAPGRSISISVTDAGLEVDEASGTSEGCERSRNLCGPF